MTIAKQLKIKEFPFEIKDANGKLIYYESSNGYWCKREYDTNGYCIYSETSDGFWSKREYDANRNCIYYEDSDGSWDKSEYDANGKLIYHETSTGVLVDNRPKTDVQKAIELLTKEGLIVDRQILKS